MGPNPQEIKEKGEELQNLFPWRRNTAEDCGANTVDLVLFTEEILNGNLHFLWSG